MAADNLLTWESTDGARRCLLIVTDEEKHHNEIGYKKIVLCKQNDNDEWQTVEEVDSIDELESFGIPPGMAS